MRSRTLQIGLGLVLLCAVAAGVSAEPKVPAAVMTAYGQGKWDAVIEQLEPRIGADDVTLDEREWYGLALDRAGRGAEAQPILRAVLKEDPTRLAAARRVARLGTGVKIKMRDPEGVGLALRAYPDDAQVVAGAARLAYWQAFSRRGVWQDDWKPDNSKGLAYLEKSNRLARRAVLLAPDDEYAREVAAVSLRAGGHYEEALAHLQALAELRPLRAHEYEDIAEMLGYIGDHDAAVQAWEQTIEADPSRRVNVWKDLARACMRAGQYEKAMRTRQAFFKQRPLDNRIRRELGEAAYFAGNYGMAIFGFREAWMADGDAAGLVGLARCALDLGSSGGAKAYMDQAIAHRESKLTEGQKLQLPASWHYVRGRIRWAQGEKGEATLDFQKATKMDEKNKEYALWAVHSSAEMNDPYGIALVIENEYEHGDKAVARELVREVRKRWPVPVRVDATGAKRTTDHVQRMYWVMSVINEDAGRYAFAWEMAKQSGGGMRPRYTSAWVAWLGMRAGDYAGAKAVFQRLSRYDPDTSSYVHGHVGLAAVAALEHDVRGILVPTTKFQEVRQLAVKPTYHHLAAIYMKKAPVKILDAYDRLGMIGLDFEGWRLERGHRVEALFPWSPLRDGELPIEPGDVILKVGPVYLTSPGAVDALRKVDLAEVESIRVRRGEFVFERDVDLAGITAASVLRKGSR